MSDWDFQCEWKGSVPLPPEYTFAQALNYLNAETNSFYILTRPDGSYMQCGGGRDRCTVEFRELHPDGSYTHSVVGKEPDSDEPAEIAMSAGVLRVWESEVFSRWDAIDLFQAFYSGENLPEGYRLRSVDL